MNNYIVNPATFYWLNVADGIKTFSIVLSVLSGLATIVIIITWLCCLYTSIDTDYTAAWRQEASVRAKVWKKTIWPFAAVFALSMLAAVFCPSRTTIIEMNIARLATYENAQWTLDTLKQAVDYVVSAIASLK